MNGISLGDFCRKRAEEISGAANNAKISGEKDMRTPQGNKRRRLKDRWTAQKRRAAAVSGKRRTAKAHRRKKHFQMHEDLKPTKGNSLGAIANRLLLVFVCSLVAKYDVSVKDAIAETAWLQGVSSQRLAKIYHHYDKYGEVYDPDDKRKYKVGSTGHYKFHRSHYGALDRLICTKLLNDKGKTFYLCH